ncbi:MAG: cyclic nucleotide-binding domain-containing protein [Pseudomonadota bacterium]|nr:cyclic nucleotide-binding domain-containing protein [Pseudomonadota bacterium]
MTITFIELAGHISFGLAALSFFVRDMIFLRSLAISSGIVGIIYNYFIFVGPLWTPIMWLFLFICINGYRIAGIILERRSIHFSEEELELHETVFQNFTPLEFMKLMRIAEWRHVEGGHQFAKQGYAIEGLSLLFNGEVSIEKDGRHLGSGRDGSMIGEMSFIRGGNATATVASTGKCRYVYWSKDELKKLLSRNPSMDIAMKHVFSLDLTQKLAGG